MPTKATSALAASASVERMRLWPCISSRSSGEATKTGSGIGKCRAFTASAIEKMTL